MSRECPQGGGGGKKGIEQCLNYSVHVGFDLMRIIRVFTGQQCLCLHYC